jgi:RimJ/RimL family protein N-acetyltransferase
MDRNDIMNYHATEHLRDQREMAIRAIRPDDKGLVIEALSKISAESIYRRLFRVKTDATAEDLKKITEVDFVNTVALVAVMGKNGDDEIVAGGRYMRHRGSEVEHRAEVAFMVGDALQGQGIASRIFKHLAIIAIGSGVRQFEAEVLPSNRAMLKVFDRSGYPVIKNATREAIHITIELTKG